MKTTQLREYTITPGQLDTFAEVWSKGVRPLRKTMGFVIEGAWKVPSEGKFVWVVSYDGAAGWDAANKRYYDSPERKAMDPDPASFIIAQRTVFIDRV
ncbi:MAG TPA: NIPSNAP family containing protein [Candidatus Limnocylindria bacterium]|nr:NIPSNAP family containing protein [Candidatus Limnocylindria bacterium]